MENNPIILKNKYMKNTYNLKSHLYTILFLTVFAFIGAFILVPCLKDTLERHHNTKLVEEQMERMDRNFQLLLKINGTSSFFGTSVDDRAKFLYVMGDLSCDDDAGMPTGVCCGGNSVGQYGCFDAYTPNNCEEISDVACLAIFY